MTTLLLDVDGVLQFAGDDLEHRLGQVRWREGYDAFLTELATDPAHLAAIVGQGEILPALQAVLGQHTSDLSATELHDLWCTRVVVNHRLVELLPQLTVDSIWLATNQDARSADVVASRFVEQGWCTGMLASCDLGARKPEPQFYSAVLDRLSAPAGRCFLVDDRAANVEGASTLGITGATYVDLPTLVTDLTHAGLLSG